MKNKIGMKQQIEAATSVAMVQALLSEVLSYTQLSMKTRKRCARLANVRVAYLNNKV